MLKSGCHTVHFLLRETVPRGFGAPFRYGLTDLRRYFVGLAGIQFEIARYLLASVRDAVLSSSFIAVLRTRGFISIGTGFIS